MKRMGKALLVVAMAAVMLAALCACSDPKADATPTNIQQQMDDGTL